MDIQEKDCGNERTARETTLCRKEDRYAYCRQFAESFGFAGEWVDNFIFAAAGYSYAGEDKKDNDLGSLLRNVGEGTIVDEGDCGVGA